MTDTKNKIIKAHGLVARSSGTLALALGQNKLGRRPMSIIVQDLREAADIVESVMKMRLENPDA